MSLATIIKKIDEEADVQCQELIAQARVEDEQIVTYARVKAQEEAANILRHAEEELQTTKNKHMGTTLLHLRKEKLDNRQRILQEVFAETLRQIAALTPDQRRAMIKAILLSVKEERQGTILSSAADQALIDQAFLQEINDELAQQNRSLRFTLSERTAEIDQGFIVDFEDFDVNYSIEKVLTGLWEDMKGDVSKRLFES
ncbi:MAG: V-type ATP synthase subunit E family protein [Candidatus Vecturithrix sp.]|jgi:vacuolar-type H+-ATPase subunit E/Vma4|nr:V-type ATP synthase subunit E family protein [Candidatus Vecturithrix sp.]